MAARREAPTLRTQFIELNNVESMHVVKEPMKEGGWVATFRGRERAGAKWKPRSRAWRGAMR